jgi:Bacterial-like globin
MTESKHTTDHRRDQCPFGPSRGFTTDETRREYLETKGIEDCSTALTLEADTDRSKPLYYWQLYSLLGTRPIYDICATFYDRVFDDESAIWFKDVFDAAGSKQYHINAQAAYWVDAFGGGRRYPGGNRRLTLHHMYNAAPIMNGEGMYDG